MGGVAACFLGLLLGSVAFLKAVERRPTRNAPVTKAVTLPAKTTSPRSRLAAQAPVSPVRRTAGVSTGASGVAPAKKAWSPANGSPATQAGADMASILARTPTSIPSQTDAFVPNVSATPPVVTDTPPPLAAGSHGASIRLHVESKPAGVDVLSKGKLLGTTPFDANLPAGDYQLVSRYKNWPEVRQPLHLDESQPSVATELHMMPPALVPSASFATTPASRSRSPQQDAIMRRNFVRSTRGTDTASGNASADPAADPAATPGGADTRRIAPALHPFDPDGVFRARLPKTTTKAAVGRASLPGLDGRASIPVAALEHPPWQPGARPTNRRLIHSRNARSGGGDATEAVEIQCFR